MKKTVNKTDLERRYVAFEGSKVEYRGEGDDKKPFLVGHAAVFNSLSENLGGFRELIHKDAFEDVLQNDVRALFNHDSNLILGRTKAGTLNISVDDKGLRYELDVPQTTAGRDLLISIERGDVTQSSFGFRVLEDNWDEDDDGRWVRTIKKVKRLFDVSPVVYPAYPEATVAKRSLDAMLEKRKNKDEADADSDLDIYKRKLNLLKLKA
tara:strand:+ start:131 stop:757 length:627 start_codon:yes stop_codon:yes gene_type:complete